MTILLLILKWLSLGACIILVADYMTWRDDCKLMKIEYRGIKNFMIFMKGWINGKY